MLRPASSTGSSADANGTREHRLAALAAEQHGVVTRAQLLAAGWASSTISSWIRRGRFHRVHHNVYAVGHPRLSTRGTWLAAVLTMGPGAVLSHVAAARAWGIWTRAVLVVDVSAPRTRAAMAGHRFHRIRPLQLVDVGVRDGIPVTSVARTIVDLAQLLTVEQLARVVHEAAFHDLLDVAAVRAAAARVRSRHRIGRVEQALDLYETGSAGTRSRLEDRCLELVRRWALPEPQVNRRITFGDRRPELDLWWPQQRLNVEIDGPGHDRPSVRRADAARDARLREHDVTVIRVRPEALRGAAGALRRSLEAQLTGRGLGDAHHVV